MDWSVDEISRSPEGSALGVLGHFGRKQLSAIGSLSATILRKLGKLICGNWSAARAAQPIWRSPPGAECKRIYPPHAGPSNHLPSPSPAKLVPPLHCNNLVIVNENGDSSLYTLP
jgi:hypothetical protein